MEVERLETEVLIIGAGAAGLRCAIELADAGVDLMVVGDRSHGDAHTRLAAGGINASLGTRDPDDDWSLHAADTIREGHFICRPRAVELLARRAPDRVRELAKWGCEFARTDDGEIDQRYFGAQSFRRTCFVGDRTGRAILETLIDRADRLEVPWRDGVRITELVVGDEQVAGAVGWDTDTGRGLVFDAKAVVVAAGGATGLYRRHSSRDDENTGDAMALALRAGAILRDMEFVQFHPTGMAWPPEERGTLVTEAVRGEGGRLYNAHSRRFMQDYDPEEMELAPRDVVARAIAAEIAAGRNSPNDGVYLDISHRDEEFIKTRLPGVWETYRDCGVDISQEPMEVAPTAHYAMGGIGVDFDTGATDVDGLFAVGEATSGLHGANRLGGNSLAETVVFGQLTGAHLADAIGDHRRIGVDEKQAREMLDHQAGWSRQNGEHRPREIIARLRGSMEQAAGLWRTKRKLTDGIQRIEHLRELAEDLRVYTAPGTAVFDRICRLRAMLETADVVLRTAEMRRESRGAHHRDDFPDKDDAWRTSIVCQQTSRGELTFDRQPVASPGDEVQKAIDRDIHLDYHHLE